MQQGSAGQGWSMVRATRNAVLATGTMLFALAAPGEAGAQGTMSVEAWKAVVAAAQKEGRVVMYTATAPAIANKVKAEFEKTYPGITFEWQRAASGPLVSKLEQERQTAVDGADVAVHTEFTWFRAKAKEGQLKPLNGPASYAWPAQVMFDGAVAIVALEPEVMMYNTNLVRTPVTGYKDAVRPEFKGKLGILDSVSTTMVAFYDWLEKANGTEHLVALAAQQPKIYPSVVVGAQSVASGEIALAHFINMSTAAATVASGAPVKVVLPNPTFSIRWPMGVFAWSKRPNAGLLLADFLMSPKGQATWNGGGESASPLQNIPGSLDNKSLNPVDLVPYTDAVVKVQTAKWNAIFKK